jgi:peptidoglycan/LPS O-acetylase OafA/YrhL
MKEPSTPEPSREPKVGGHIPALDAIRGLAILMVMVYHFFDVRDITHNESMAAPGQILWGQGSFGVDLFFVLSGYLITGILADTKSASRYFRNFYIRRSLRIFPLYWGVLFATFWLLPLMGFHPYSDTAQHQAWLWLYGTNFFQALQDSWPLSGFNHFWSLAVEEHFYLVWPLVIFWCNRRSAMFVSLACIVGAIALRLGLTLWGGFAANAPAVYALTPCRMDALALGALLALAVRGPGGVRAVLPWAYGAGAVGGVLLLANLALAKRLEPWGPWMQGAVALRSTLYSLVFGAMLIWAVITAPGSVAGRFWSSRILRFFGKYSYALYVFHYMLRPLFLALFPLEQLTRVLGSATLGWLALVLLSSTGTIAVALLSWDLYEKHFLKLKDVLAGQQRAPAPALEPATAPAG